MASVSYALWSWCRPAALAQVRAAAARQTHWLKGTLYLPVGLKFWRQGAPGWAIAADAAAYLAVTLLLLPTCMALAEVRLDALLTISATGLQQPGRIQVGLMATAALIADGKE